jgi:hypothetical protein
MELDLTRHPVGVLPSTHDHPEASTPTLLPRVGDRIGSARLLVPGVVLTACGTITLVLPLGGHPCRGAIRPPHALDLTVRLTEKKKQSCTY